MLSGEWEMGSASDPFAELGSVLRGDLVFANLETTVECADGHIPKAPRIFASPTIIDRTLGSLGIDVVNLANNHAFDGLLAGFRNVREILEARGVRHFGAGANLAEAARPCCFERGGICFGWLGYAAPDTVLSHAASSHGFGVNLLEPERAVADVARLRNQVDQVIVSLHWGVEYCHVPSPEQIRFARFLIDHGARLVIGHHAHVVQGVERYKEGVIAYNLGNATTTDHYVNSRRSIRQTFRTRSSFVLRITLDKSGIERVATLPIRCHAGRIVVDDERAARYLQRANRHLARGVSTARWKRKRFIEDVILRTLKKLHPSVILSVRAHHFGKFFRNALRSLKGLGPAS